MEAASSAAAAATTSVMDAPTSAAAAPSGAAVAPASDAGSGSSSGSSDSSSDSDERRRREEKRKRKRREKKEKKAKKKAKKERDEAKQKKKHKSSRDEGEVQRSVITGKRIKRAEGSLADAEGEARRAKLLAKMNGDEAASAWAKPEKTELDDLRERARFDPELMKELMVKGQQAQREREKRRGKPMASAARQQYLADVLAEQRAQGLR